MASSFANAITIAIIRFRVNKVLQNEIISKSEKNENVTTLIDVLKQVQTDVDFLMQLVTTSIVFVALNKDVKTCCY